MPVDLQSEPVGSFDGYYRVASNWKRYTLYGYRGNDVWRLAFEVEVSEDGKTEWFRWSDGAEYLPDEAPRDIGIVVSEEEAAMILFQCEEMTLNV